MDLQEAMESVFGVFGSKLGRPLNRGKHHLPYSSTLPKEVELLVLPFVKSLLFPMNATIIGPDPPPDT